MKKLSIKPKATKKKKKKKETILTKAPGTPKRFRSSYILFQTHVKDSIIKNLPEGQKANVSMIGYTYSAFRINIIFARWWCSFLGCEDGII